MLRTLKAIFLLGLLITIVVGSLVHFDVFHRWDSQLQALLGLPEIPASLPSYQYLLIVGLGFGIAWTTINIPRAVLRLVVLVAVLLQLGSMVFVGTLYGEFFTPFPAAFATIGAYLVGSLYACSQGGCRKRVLNQVFGQRLSQKSMNQLVSEKAPVVFDGEFQQGSVLECHFFNHTELIDELSPQDYVSMVNLWLATASRLLVDAGAYIDACDGERLRAIFGAPVATESHASDACRAAVALDKRLQELNIDCNTRCGHTLDFRIGLESGAMISANYGSEVLGRFSCAGETIDLAASLCRANRLYSTTILVGPRMFEDLKEEMVLRPIDLLPLAEQDTVIEVYEPLGSSADLTEEERAMQKEFWQGVVLFREKRYDDAADCFWKIIKNNPDDKSACFYRDRIEKLRKGGSDPVAERAKSLRIL